MIELDGYLRDLTSALKTAFGDAFLYLGLQGSYRRGEATEASDIDPMVVLEELTPRSMQAYRAIIESLPRPDLSCGFIAGRAELKHWNACEACQLLNETRDVYGTLAPLLPPYTRDDLLTYVKISIGNLYHELCHRYIHRSRERNAQRLPDSCKAVFYILQNLTMWRTGTWHSAKRDLLEALTGEDRAVLSLAMRLRSGGEYDFDEAFSLVHGWCRHTLASL